MYIFKMPFVKSQFDSHYK